MGLLTLPDLFRRKYGALVEVIVSLIEIVSFTFLLAGNLVGISLILRYCFGMPKFAGVILAGGLMCIFTAAGGLYAVALTDLPMVRGAPGGGRVAAGGGDGAGGGGAGVTWPPACAVDSRLWWWCMYDGSGVLGPGPPMGWGSRRACSRGAGRCMGSLQRGPWLVLSPPPPPGLGPWPASQSLWWPVAPVLPLRNELHRCTSNAPLPPRPRSRSPTHLPCHGSRAWAGRFLKAKPSSPAPLPPRPGLRPLPASWASW